MSKFIGVKMVEAVPMTAIEASKKHYRVGQDGTLVPPKTEGYEVTYEDGYLKEIMLNLLKKILRILFI